jgi:hypothetical protein
MEKEKESGNNIIGIFMIGEEEGMNFSMGHCCLISFSTREYYILLTAFFISFPNSPSFFKKRGPAFPIPSSSPSFSSLPPRPQPSPAIRYQCLVLLPHEPADDAHGPGTVADPVSNAGQCPIQYPGLLPCSISPPSLSFLSSPLYRCPRSNILASWYYRNSRQSVAEVVPRARRTRSPALLLQRRPARRHPRGSEAGPPRYAIILISST